MRGIGQADRILRLLEEPVDAARVRRVHLDDTELVGERDGLPDRRNRCREAGLDVRIDHLAEVHAVDVVGADHGDDVGLLVVDEVQALQDRIGRS